MMPSASDIIAVASKRLLDLAGHTFDVLELNKPVSPNAAVNLAKVVSKLSPLLGNLIEFNTVEFLNDTNEFPNLGQWHRQDPGFPDAIFRGSVSPQPGFEIKAWFPLATEITARFKDSQSHFREDQTHVCLLAWLPSELIFGRPCIQDVCVVSGKSVAKARDDHYHNPPDYLVIEPGDTTARTANLQQTNTNGYKFQGDPTQFAEAQEVVAGWESGARLHSGDPAYQLMLSELMGRFPYRLDTNFAKMDRIRHPEIEAFKTKVLAKTIHGLSISAWSNLLFRGSDTAIRKVLSQRFDIKDEDATRLVR
jgi:hypothetical protein